MMTSEPIASAPSGRDLLLSGVRLVLTAGLAACIFGMIALPVAPTVAALRWDEWTANLATNRIGVDAAPWILALVVLVGAMVALGFFFLRDPRRIVDSVAKGDPFVTVNADRLRGMAWPALAVQAIAIPATGLAILFDSGPFKATAHHGDDRLSHGIFEGMV